MVKENRIRLFCSIAVAVVSFHSASYIHGEYVSVVSAIVENPSKTIVKLFQEILFPNSRAVEENYLLNIKDKTMESQKKESEKHGLEIKMPEQDEIKTVFEAILAKLTQIQETLNEISEGFATIISNLYPDEDLEEQPSFTIDKPQQIEKNSSNYIS